MRTRKMWMALVAVFMGSQVMLFAQQKNEAGTERDRSGREQMQEMQCGRMIDGLALDDATAAKFSPVYKQYMAELRATRMVDRRGNISRKTDAGQQTPKPVLTDAEVEQAIKAQFARNRKMLDIREKYYAEFRKFLSPKQIQKMYAMEKRHGDKFRKEMSKRQGVKKQHEGKKSGEAKQG